MDDWMATPPPPAAYCTLMACDLVVLDKSLEVHPVGIRKTLCRAITKLVMRSAWYKSYMACRNLQLCAGLNAVIEGETCTEGQRLRGQPARWKRKKSVNDMDDEEEE